MRCLPILLTLCSLPLLHYCATAQTQLELNEEAGNEFTKADAALNAAYKETMAALAEPLKTQLKETQRAWIVYRDKAAQAQAALYEGGSMQPMIEADTMARLTQERTERLKGMVPAETAARAAKLPSPADATARLQEADALLNKVYKAYMADASETAGPLMKEAQKAWIAYRDLCIKSEKALFDANKAEAAATFCTTELTQTRTAWLKEMFIEGYDE